MSIRYNIKVLFVSIATFLMAGQLHGQESDSALVNIGYGITVAADEMSSAVGVATADDLSKFFAVNPYNALYGQIPGLTVLQNGGEWWGQFPSMTVRGQSNLSTNTSDALVLIDGFERCMSTITVADIENVSVLKDAAATALYGQRGANGVILVTTKRGYDEGFHVNLTYEHSINQPFRLPQMLDAYGYASAMNEALTLDGQDFLYSKEKLDAYQDGTYPDYYPNVNWMDEVLRQTGFVDNLNATFRGGNGKTKYYVSMNYMGGEGLLDQERNTNDFSTQLSYNRMNVRTNLDVELTKSTQLKFNLSGRISGFNRPGKATSTNLFGLLYGTPSNAYPVMYSDGKWGGSSVYNENPVADVFATGYSESHERTFFTDMTLTQDLGKFVDGLSASAAVSFDNDVTYWDSKTKPYSYSSRTADIDEVSGTVYNVLSSTYDEDLALSSGTSFGGQSRHTNGIVKLNYDQQFGMHKLNATAFMHVDNAVIGAVPSTTYNRMNYAAHIHYAYNSKYLADLSMSYSGNNILPDDNRFGFYPALSLGWLISEESFLSDVGAINQLKLRASAGLTGLEPQSMYLDLVKYGGGGAYYYDDNNKKLSGFKEDRRANPDVLPEKGFVTNVGVDARLFESLSLNVDAFYERRSQILVSEENSTSMVMGVPSTVVNDGIVDSKGIELGALWNQSIGDLKFAIGGNFSFVRSKIIEQNEIYREWDYLRRTGHPVGQAFGLEDDGFWGVNDGLNGVDNLSPEGVTYSYTSVLKPGDVKYVDQNNDDRIDEFDMIAIGKSWFPEIYFGFNVNAEYKGFGLNALFQGISNVSTTLNTAGIFWPLYNNNNISTFSNDRWTPATATTATLPRLTPEENKNNYRASTIWQRDASYLKLRSLEVYYNLPTTLTSKAKIKTSKVFVRGLNLFSIDNIKIMDPEELGTKYPTLRSFNVGLSIGF